jgi:tetratricopeptide (TPR) repeat protein
MSLRARASLIFLAAAVAGAPLLAQEWRGGRARVEGTVKNEKGEPIAGAKVHLRWKQNTDGPDLTTDKKGKWAMLGIVGGAWNIDFEAPGYQTRQISAELKEAERNPPIDIQLQPAPQAKSGEEVISIGGKRVSKQTADAIERGNAALDAKKYAEAREAYLQALAEVPDNPALLMRVAAASYADGKLDDAVKYAHQAADADPQDPAPWRMIAEIELQRGNLDAGQAALAKVPAEKIKDGQPYLNMGILLLNKKKAAEAETAFSKAVSVQPDLADAYYMRALARVQLKKKADARADLEKYLQLAPGGNEAKDARDLLKSLS